MTDIKYIVIDESDAYHTSVREHKTKDSMIDDIQDCNIDDIKVYEVSRRVRFEKRLAIIEKE